MRDTLVVFGRWLIHTFEVWRDAFWHGATAVVSWLGVGWLVVLAFIALGMALWGLKVHRG